MSTVMSNKTIRFCIVIWWFMIVVVFTGCATVADDFKVASNQGTTESYEKFIKKHPDSPYAIEARDKLATLAVKKAFEETEQKNLIADYNEFIRNYPDSEYAEIAKKRLTESDDDAFRRSFNIGSAQADVVPSFR